MKKKEQPSIKLDGCLTNTKSTTGLKKAADSFIRFCQQIMGKLTPDEAVSEALVAVQKMDSLNLFEVACLDELSYKPELIHKIKNLKDNHYLLLKVGNDLKIYEHGMLDENGETVESMQNNGISVHRIHESPPDDDNWMDPDPD